MLELRVEFVTHSFQIRVLLCNHKVMFAVNIQRVLGAVTVHRRDFDALNVVQVTRYEGRQSRFANATFLSGEGDINWVAHNKMGI